MGLNGVTRAVRNRTRLCTHLEVRNDAGKRVSGCPRLARQGFKFCPQCLHNLGQMDRVRKIIAIRKARREANG
jgi:hypothetical protein